MALWSRVEKLPRVYFAELQNTYPEPSFLTIRKYLAIWIEEKQWDKLDEQNVQHKRYAKELIDTFLQEIEIKANLECDFDKKVNLKNAIALISQNYIQNPFHLINLVKKCLKKESDLLKLFETYQINNLPYSNENKTNAEFELDFATLKNITIENEKRCTNLIDLQSSFFIDYSNSVQNIQNIENYKNQVQMSLTKQASMIRNGRFELLNNLKNTFDKIVIFENFFQENELKKWKRSQQLMGNKANFDNNTELDRLQEWAEFIADILCRNLQVLKNLGELHRKLSLDQNELLHHISNSLKDYSILLRKLIHSTFIIEKQPPQVMKTNTRFSSTIRLLVGVKFSLHLLPPSVQVNIISENQAKNLIKTNNVNKNEYSGEILNNTYSMEHNPTSKTLSLNFRNMQLKKIKRAEKKGTESVMDEKFSLLFFSQFKIDDETYEVWTLSLPVVVIVHGNQEPHAWATVTWDNAFAIKDREPFLTPDAVPWFEVGEVLSMKFETVIGRELSRDCLRFLACKALRKPETAIDLDHEKLSWTLFSKEPIPDRNFTFWEWFYAVLKVTKEHLGKLWQDNLISFISKNQARELLKRSPVGTFLIRYSDSMLGAVSIACRTENEDGLPEVIHVKPLLSKQLQTRALADRINDVDYLKYLYPDTPKDLAFGKYFTNLNENLTSQDGYVESELVTKIPVLIFETQAREIVQQETIFFEKQQHHTILDSQSESLMEHFNDSNSVLDEMYPGNFLTEDIASFVNLDKDIDF